MEYVTMNNINSQKTLLRLIANIALGKYCSLLAKLLGHLQCSIDHSECFQCTDSLNPHSNLMR